MTAYMTWVMTVLPLVLLVLGFPIFVILLATSAIAIVCFYSIPPTALQQVMFGTLDSSALLAVPFFIFAGEIMGFGGISRRLVDWTKSLLGGTKASLPITTVGTCVVFGAISGSSAATVAAVGRITFKPMVDAGYDVRFATGLLTASGPDRQHDPARHRHDPLRGGGRAVAGSHFHRRVRAGLPVCLGFRGLHPGEVLAQHHRSARAVQLGTPCPRDGQRGLGARHAAHHPRRHLFRPVLGDRSRRRRLRLRHLVAVVVYREVGLADLMQFSRRAAYITSQIMIIVASAGVFSWLLTTSGVGPSITAFFELSTCRPGLLLLIINVFSC